MMLFELTENSSDDVVFDDPARELFIWCIFVYMKDMAMVFWDEGKVR